MLGQLEERLRSELVPDLEVIRPLGKGGHAEVFLAREPALKRLVALKVLRPELATDSVLRRRFEREAQSEARISHPNITQVHRVGRLSDNIPYIVLEYIEGRTLADTVAAGGPLEPERAADVLVAIASALAAAHERGIVHRDVRPGNVFVENRTGRAVLGDFGIAGLLETGSETVTQLTAAGVKLGDVRYMSPEQLRSEPVTEQSDVYSFGVLAFEVLTGQLPFDGRLPAQVAAAHLRQDPPSPLALRPDMPSDLATLVLRCLSKEPQRRPRAAELPALLGGGDPSGAPAMREPQGLLAEFLGELNRRRVYRVAVAYAAVGFALVEVANNFVPPLGLPEWSTTAVAVLVVGGFPVALALSWIYDFRAGRIERTGEKEETGTARLLPWIGLGISIAVAVALALVVLL